MSRNNYTLEIQSLILSKFAGLKNGFPKEGNKNTSIDLIAQVLNINLYESIFSNLLKVEVTVGDHIGLFTNFPLTGEEVLTVRYKTVKDMRKGPVEKIHDLYFFIESYDHIQISDSGHENAFIIKATSIEVFEATRKRVQKGYEQKAVPEMVKELFEEFISAPTKRTFPGYVQPPLIMDNNDLLPQTIVIPNVHPFAGIRVLSELAVSSTPKKHTYMFYQTLNNFKFETIQGMFADSRSGASRRLAFKNKYVYNAMDVDIREDSPLYNEGRLVTNLHIHQRINTFEKMTHGYYHNNLAEINIAQKAIWNEHTKISDGKVGTIYEHPLNTPDFIDAVEIKEGRDEESNRTKYVLTSRNEHDIDFPIMPTRERWGPDTTSSIALGQIELTITIPGTNLFSAGDLFYLEIPETHGFNGGNELGEDDLISGFFLITEVKHLLKVGGFHSTVMRISRDSYKESIHRPSRYV